MKRKLQESQEALHRKIATATDNGSTNRTIDDLRRQLNNIDNKMGLIGQDLTSMKSTVDKHTHDIMNVNNDVKNRPLLDPNVKLVL